MASFETVMPNSNAHRWGSRFYEATRKADAWVIRQHDVSHFQGVGMEPGDMSGPSHRCSAWIPAPENIAAKLRAGVHKSCEEATYAFCEEFAKAIEPPQAEPADADAPMLSPDEAVMGTCE